MSNTPTICQTLTPEDVTGEYLAHASPEQGVITYQDGYKAKTHQAEIAIAQWLHRTFGGTIILLAESTERGQKMPDYLWNGKEWELKSVHSINGADKSTQHAIKQIQDIPGGIILDILEDLDMPALERQILGRFLRSNVSMLDVIFLSNGKLVKISRHKK